MSKSNRKWRQPRSANPNEILAVPAELEQSAVTMDVPTSGAIPVQLLAECPRSWQSRVSARLQPLDGWTQRALRVRSRRCSIRLPQKSRSSSGRSSSPCSRNHASVVDLLAASG
jgi:hypothetical protein